MNAVKPLSYQEAEDIRRQREAEDQEAIEAFNRIWRDMELGEEADLLDTDLDEDN